MRLLLTVLTTTLLVNLSNAQSLQITSSASSIEQLEGSYSDGEVNILESGNVINSGEFNRVGDDPSFKIYPLQNGSYIVRENIANFVLFDSFGSVIRPISNSSQSEDGEKISELAMDPMGKTIVLYNPQIRNGTKRDSQAKIVGLEGADRDVFYRKIRK